MDEMVDMLRSADAAHAEAISEVEDLKERLAQARDEVTAAGHRRERAVLTAREAGMTWRAIGEALGVSHARAVELARQAERR